VRKIRIFSASDPDLFQILTIGCRSPYTGVVDRHSFDVDPDPTVYFDAEGSGSGSGRVTFLCEKGTVFLPRNPLQTHNIG
jgi:hypothetical protein